MLISGSVGTKINLFHSFGKQIKGLFQDPELLKSCGDIPIPELKYGASIVFLPTTR